MVSKTISGPGGVAEEKSAHPAAGTLTRSGHAKESFWTEYNSTLEKLGVTGRESKYYVQWAQRFERFINGMAFDQVTPEIVQGFLADAKEQDWTPTQPTLNSHSERIPRSLAPGVASDYKDSFP